MKFLSFYTKLKNVKKVGFLSLFFLFFILNFCFLFDHFFVYPLKYKIATQERFDPKLEVPPLNEEEFKKLDEILSRSFTYFNSGSQCYVFLSEDKTHVLKFFKQKPKKTLLTYFPFLRTHASAKKKVIKDGYRSCSTAYLKLRELTGILYLHLNKTPLWNKEVLIFDRKGRAHRLELGQYSFILQKKAQLFCPYITQLMSEDRQQEAKQAITQVFEFLKTIGEKGVVNNDLILKRNFGFIDGKLIQIDTGKLEIDLTLANPKLYDREIPYLTKGIKKWIDETYPILSSHLEEEIRKRSSS